MKFVLFIAKRYLFSRKKHGLVNLISTISMAGVAIGTMALIIVMSIINGLDHKVHQTYSEFEPDLEIFPNQGSVFSIKDSVIAAQFKDTCFRYVGKRMKQQALIKKNGIQIPVLITGVDTTYYNASSIQKFMWTGRYNVHHTKVPMAVLGMGLANELGTGIDLVSPTLLYVPKRTAKVNLLRPDAAFKRFPFYIGGIVNVDIQAMDQLVLMPLEQVQNLYSYSSEWVTSIALNVKNFSDSREIEKRLESTLGKAYNVVNRQESNSDLFQMLRIEKWMTFLILAFIVLISICNVIGSLSMLIIDKENDIRLLGNLGATHRIIKQIFWIEGWLITIVGSLIGVFLGLVFCLLQYHFSWIMMGQGAYAIAYPVVVEWLDVVLISITVLLMGSLIAYYPAFQLSKRIPK